MAELVPGLTDADLQEGMRRFRQRAVEKRIKLTNALGRDPTAEELHQVIENDIGAMILLDMEIRDRRREQGHTFSEFYQHFFLTKILASGKLHLISK